MSDMVITLSGPIEQYIAAVEFMPTTLMRVMFRTNLEERDIDIKDRTLYVPIPSESAISLLENEQLTFFRCVDRAFYDTIDSIVYWQTNSVSGSYKFMRIYHPLYLAANKTSCKATCRSLNCIPAQYIDYIIWFQENSNTFNRSYVEGIKMLDRLSWYIELMAEYNEKQDEEENDERF